jgi:hypothetical protein
MADEFVHNNPQDLPEEIFESLEAHVVDINRNMNLLMEALENKLESLEEVGGSNSKIRSEGKLGDSEDPEKES